jgi:hypothetical protein
MSVAELPLNYPTRPSIYNYVFNSHDLASHVYALNAPYSLNGKKEVSEKTQSIFKANTVSLSTIIQEKFCWQWKGGGRGVAPEGCSTSCQGIDRSYTSTWTSGTAKEKPFVCQQPTTSWVINIVEVFHLDVPPQLHATAEQGYFSLVICSRRQSLKRSHTQMSSGRQHAFNLKIQTTNS